MRRADREVTDPARIADVIRRCTCCRIGFYDDGEVYIVPLNFGYEARDGTYVFYFHGAHAGRKFDLIGKEPKVGFEMDTDYALHIAETACGHSARFQSVIGTGVIRVVTAPEEKRHGLSLLMEHTAGDGAWDFDEKTVNAVAVFRLEATALCCKEHQ